MDKKEEVKQEVTTAKVEDKKVEKKVKEKKPKKKMDNIVILCILGILLFSFLIALPPISRMIWGRKKVLPTTKEIVNLDMTCSKRYSTEDYVVTRKIVSKYIDGDIKNLTIEISVSLRGTTSLESILIKDIEIPEYSQLMNITVGENARTFEETDTMYKFEFDYTKFNFRTVEELSDYSAISGSQQLYYSNNGYMCETNSKIETIDL